MVCAAGGHLSRIGAAPENLLAWPAQKTAGVGCGEDRGVFPWLERLLEDVPPSGALGSSTALLDTLLEPQPCFHLSFTHLLPWFLRVVGEAE